MEPETVPLPETLQGPDLEAVLAGLETRLDRLVETRLDAAEVHRRQDEREALVARFATDNPDFRELAAAGTLEAVKSRNPLLDDVGAYFAHRLETERQAAAATVAQARQEAEAAAEARLVERFKAKRLAATLSAAPAGPARGQGLDPELGAPEQFGGLNAVLAARLEARRKAFGN